MRLSRTLDRPASTLPPRAPKPNEVVYHRELSATRDDLRHLIDVEHDAMEVVFKKQVDATNGLDRALRATQSHVNALEIALASTRAEMERREYNRLSARFARFFFRRIF